jgi:hypothetical protein
MAESMEGIEPVKPSLLLPRPEGELDPAWRDPPAGLRAEERVLRSEPLAPYGLVPPELPELGQQGVRQEDVATPATLGDLRP